MREKAQSLESKEDKLEQHRGLIEGKTLALRPKQSASGGKT